MPRSPAVPVRPDASRAGKALLIVLGVLALILVVVVASGVGQYNSLVGADESVQAKWSEVQNQYKRRYDLVPQLVETVQGAADFERSTITEVTEARASVGKLALPSTLPEDPAQLKAYFDAQQSLGQSLGRLLVVAENYPSLKASQNFLSLQDQLEGTENRIAVARRDYIDVIQGYNRTVRSFPANLLAGTFGFERRDQYLPSESAEDLSTAPAVRFGD